MIGESAVLHRMDAADVSHSACDSTANGTHVHSERVALQKVRGQGAGVLSLYTSPSREIGADAIFKS